MIYRPPIYRIFASYLGAKVRMGEVQPKDDGSDDTFTLIDVDHVLTLYSVNSAAFQLKETGQWFELHADSLDHCPHKLILKRLYTITDEHGLEIARLAGIHNPVIMRTEQCLNIEGDNGAPGKSNKKRSIKLYYTPSNIRIHEESFEIIEYSIPIFDFLRGEYYDCGWGPVRSLIDENFAIEG